MIFAKKYLRWGKKKIIELQNINNVFVGGGIEDDLYFLIFCITNIYN